MNENKKPYHLMWALSLGFAMLMSLPYLVPHCGAFALIGWIPLLCMERIGALSGVKRLWRWHYCAFVLWNAFTTFWVCNATLGGGIFAILANALQMSLIFGTFRLSRRAFRGVLPYLFLALMWIAWERAYFSAQISWPWLVLGNSFAGTVSLCQWYEFTGTLGGSLWIWATNLSLFGVMCALSDGSWSLYNAKARAATLSLILIIFFGPMLVSAIIYHSYEETSDPLEVLITQPNNSHGAIGLEQISQSQANAILLDQIKHAIPRRTTDDAPLLILVPETFTNDVITNDITRSTTFRRFHSFLQDYPETNLLFGSSAYTLSSGPEAPSPSARRLGDGEWIESHNTAIMTDPSGRVELCHKNKLVVGVEMMPYPKVFAPLDDLLGGAMGRCVGQGEAGILNVTGREGTKIPLGCIICYESIYGEYCTEYIRKGARVLAVITNDEWWKDTPGYRQHLRYSCLRAIETRRDIARSANTGLSAFINQRGDILQRTHWWKAETLHGSVNLNDEVTFFVKNGDIIGKLCSFLFVLLLLALAARLIINRN